MYTDQMSLMPMLPETSTLIAVGHKPNKTRDVIRRSPVYPGRAGMGRASCAAATGEKATSDVTDRKTPSRGHDIPYADHGVHAGTRESRREIRYGVKNYGRNGRTLS